MSDKTYFYINDDNYTVYGSFIDDDKFNITHIKGDEYINVEINDAIPPSFIDECQKGRIIVFNLGDNKVIGGVIHEISIEPGSMGVDYQNLKIVIKSQDQL